jgi:acetyltransferase-like isoleucine patch superfamily enzyme
MLTKVIKRIIYLLAKINRPIMINGYRNADGTYRPNTRIGNSTYIDYKQHLKIADYVYIGHHNFIEASNHIIIDAGVQITSYCTLTTHSSHDSIRLYGPEYGGQEMLGYLRGSIVIGAYTFVGPYSTIMPGTKIGKGCLVSSYSNLKGEYPDFSIISGNPATVVGDTRDRDERFFKQHPELLDPKFQAWRK